MVWASDVGAHHAVATLLTRCAHSSAAGHPDAMFGFRGIILANQNVFAFPPCARFTVLSRRYTCGLWAIRVHVANPHEHDGEGERHAPESHWDRCFARPPDSPAGCAATLRTQCPHMTYLGVVIGTVHAALASPDCDRSRFERFPSDIASSCFRLCEWTERAGRGGVGVCFCAVVIWG